MSFIKVFFNLFYRTNRSAKTSTQQLYSMYLVFSKHNKTLTFNQFYIYFILSKRHFNKANCNCTYVFLGYLFFLKTFKTKYVTSIGDLGDVISNKNTTQGFSVDNNMFDFWKRFQKLKRPTTDLSYTEYYITMYKSKIDKYSKLGFLVITDSFYIARAKSENLLQNSVQVNKPLLVAPKFSSSSLNKYLGLGSLQNFEFQFLRKNKVYNKGRYSRCRQNYRTGVYMCMYLSVVSIFGLYYWFYKFSFNFTYLWWLFISFVASFFLPKIIKYRFYEPYTLVLKLFDFFKWIFLIIKSLLK